MAVEDAVRAARAWLARPIRADHLDAYAPAADIRLWVFDHPRPQRLWIVRINTQAPGTSFLVTEPAPSMDADGKRYETRSETTLDFARRRGVQLAVNTSAFGPLREKSAEPMDVAGLAAADGHLYSQPVKNYGAMYVSRDGRVALRGPPLEQKDVWQVIPGFRMLLDDRAVVVDPADLATGFGQANPRTAVGVDQGGRTIWLVVADGRQPGIAVGLTLAELAAVFEILGAFDALNLDGGGSSTVVIRDANGVRRVLNTPIHAGVRGNLRQVANNLGVMLSGNAPTAAAVQAIREGAAR